MGVNRLDVAWISLEQKLCRYCTYLSYVLSSHMNGSVQAGREVGLIDQEDTPRTLDHLDNTGVNKHFSQVSFHSYDRQISGFMSLLAQSE